MSAIAGSSLSAAEKLIRDNSVDTVRVGAVDLDGVWRGKQVSAAYFLESVAASGTQISDILFGWDVADRLVDGLSFTGWDTGYPDIKLLPDLSTLSLMPWEPNTASVICDMFTVHGEPLNLSPRSLLRAAVAKSESLGYTPYAAYEFEFFILDHSIGGIADSQWRDIKPVSKSGYCYSMLHHASSSDVLGLIRKQLREAGVDVEVTNSEHGPGQYEINVKYAGALKAADTAIILKNAIKEIAAKQGMTATFMAKPKADWSGSSGHVHMSLSDAAGKPAFASTGDDRSLSDVGNAFLAGMVKLARDMSVLYLPNLNSFKRKVGGSWSGSNASWGYDNRTVSFRALPSSGKAARVENRVPGADTNPYLVIAASLYSGLYGIEEKLKATNPMVGNAYKASAEQATPLAKSLDEAIEIFRDSAAVKSVFPQQFIDHVVQMKLWEIAQSQAHVTDWELARYLEII